MGEKERIKLKSLKLSGYKSFKSHKNPDEITFGDINVIIGANGSGKSNLVLFFEMFDKMMSGLLQVYIGMTGYSDSFLHYGAKFTKSIDAVLSFSNTHYDIYKFQLSMSHNNKLVYTKEIVEHSIKEKNKNFLEFDLGSGHKESGINMGYDVEESGVLEAIYNDYWNSIKTFQFQDTSPESYMRRSVYIEDNLLLYSDGANLAPYLYRLKNTPEFRKYYDRIIKRIKMVMPQFLDFSLEPSTLGKDRHISLNWKSSSRHEYLFGPHQISDGTLRFIALATLLLQPPEKLPKIIIIDEPELGLHPSALSVLAGMIRTASQHSQIIIATQSTRLVDEFECEDIIVAEWDTKENSSKFKRLDHQQLGEWLENYSLSELWEKNVLGGQP